MKPVDLLIQSAMATLLVFATTSTAIADSKQHDSKDTTEKCYGIAKAGMNDCATATASCASSSTKDSQADAFVLLPKGMCDRIVGGKLK